MGLTYVFISHSLSVVENISNHVAVMYLGKIVEIGKTEDIFNRPGHPYTKALISAIPVPDPKHKASRMILEGDVPARPNHFPVAVSAHGVGKPKIYAEQQCRTLHWWGKTIK